MPLIGVPLVGREAPLGELMRRLSATAEGTGSCVVVEGPAGIGKSRLLSAVAEAAVERGLAVAIARPTELDRIAPLGALVRALRSAVPPVVDDAAAEDLLEQESNRFWLLGRLGELIEEFTADRALIMILDDTHWADELTALALRTIVPGMLGSPVLWLIARRPQSTKSPARDAVDWLLSEGVTLLRLDPLSEEDVERLCAHVLGSTPDHSVLALARRAGGNPFLLERLLTTLVTEGRVVIDGDEAAVLDGSLPGHFLNAVDVRLRDLPPSARRLLDVASVIGRPFTMHEAAGLAGTPAMQLLAAAEAAVNAGVLVDSGTELAFVHDIVREAVYQSLSGPARHALHREAAIVLEREGRPAIEVAEHIVRSARRGDRWAVALLRQAAAAIAPRAPETAAGLLLRALLLIEDDDPEHGRTVAEAVRLLASVGRLDEARQLGESALEHRLDAETEATILLGLAEVLKHAGEDAAAVETTSRALAAPGVSELAQAHLFAIRAHAMLYIDELNGADEAGARAVEAGAAAGEDAAVVFGLVARSVVARSRGQLDQAVRLSRDAVRLADSAGGAARRRHPGLWLARALVAVDRFTEADAMLELGQREANQLGTAWSQPLWHFYRAELRLASGRLDDAEVEVEAGLTVTEELSARALAVPLHGAAAELALRRDDLALATAHVERARERLAAGIGAMPEDLGWVVAQVYEAGGDLKAALDVLAPIYEGLPDRLLMFSQEPWVASQLVRLALANDAEDWARAAAQAARVLADANPRVASLNGAALHAEGLLRADRSLLHRAVAAYRTSPRPLASASAMEDAARAEQRYGAHTESVELFIEAIEIYEECVSPRDHARVRRDLRALGVRRRALTIAPAAGSGWTSLTEAELRVVRLVAEGMSNRATAARLFLSPHTVDTHLRHAFAKLGVSSRVELTRQVLEHDGAR